MVSTCHIVFAIGTCDRWITSIKKKMPIEQRNEIAQCNKNMGVSIGWMRVSITSEWDKIKEVMAASVLLLLRNFNAQCLAIILKK